MGSHFFPPRHVFNLFESCIGPTVKNARASFTVTSVTSSWNYFLEEELLEVNRSLQSLEYDEMAFCSLLSHRLFLKVKQ